MSEKSKTAQNRRLVLDFLGHIDLELNLAANTIAAYRHDLFEYCDFLEKKTGPLLAESSHEDVMDFIFALRHKGVSARSAARKLSTLRHLYKFLIGEKKCSTDPTAILDSPKLLRALPEVLSEEEVKRILESITGEEPLVLRDRAICELWYACGLRISEVAALKLADVVLELELARVRGKGGKQRLVPFGAYARRALVDYLQSGRSPLLKARSSDYLFVSQKGGRLSRMGLWEIFKKHTRTAGIDRAVTPHILRHSCATHMIQRGADVRTVMEFLGHADITTTQIYTHLDQRYLKEIHRRFHPREQEHEKRRTAQKPDLDSAGKATRTGKKPV